MLAPVKKKSFNLDSDLQPYINILVEMNRGLTATAIFNQAVRQWLKSPAVRFNENQGVLLQEPSWFEIASKRPQEYEIHN